MDQKYNAGGANTILVVLILLILAGVGFWYFTKEENTDIAPADDSLNIDLSASGFDVGSIPQ